MYDRKLTPIPPGREEKEQTEARLLVDGPKKSTRVVGRESRSEDTQGLQLVIPCTIRVNPEARLDLVEQSVSKF